MRTVKVSIYVVAATDCDVRAIRHIVSGALCMQLFHSTEDIYDVLSPNEKLTAIGLGE